jgi:hypothetical protein
MTAITRSDPARREDQRHPPLEAALPTSGLARIPVQVGEPIRCRHCHSAAPERLYRLVGAWSVIDGEPVWDCAACTRDQLFEIESGSAWARSLAARPRD